jgi:hypothetical protein
MDDYRERQEAAAGSERDAFAAGRDGFGFSPGTFMAIGFWPLCGVLTLGAGIGTLALLGVALPRLGDGLSMLIALGAAVAGLVVGWKIEQRLAVSLRYRLLRHVVRLVWLGFLFTCWALVGSMGGAYSVWPERITLEWIDSKLSPGMYVAILVGIVIAHFVSRAFDARRQSFAQAAG